MGLKKRMKSLTREVLAELALDYRVQNVFEPQHSPGIWGISFFDRYAPPGHHVFQIAVGPVDEATLSLTRADLRAKLSGRRSTCAPSPISTFPSSTATALVTGHLGDRRLPDPGAAIGSATSTSR